MKEIWLGLGWCGQVGSGPAWNSILQYFFFYEHVNCINVRIKWSSTTTKSWRAYIHQGKELRPFVWHLMKLNDECKFCQICGKLANTCILSFYVQYITQFLPLAWSFALTGYFLTWELDLTIGSICSVLFWFGSILGCKVFRSIWFGSVPIRICVILIYFEHGHHFI